MSPKSNGTVGGPNRPQEPRQKLIFRVGSVPGSIPGSIPGSVQISKVFSEGNLALEIGLYAC